MLQIDGKLVNELINDDIFTIKARDPTETVTYHGHK